MNDERRQSAAVRAMRRTFDERAVYERAWGDGFAQGWRAALDQAGNDIWESGFEAGAADREDEICADAWASGVEEGRLMPRDDLYRQAYADALADQREVTEKLKRRLTQCKNHELEESK